MTEPAPPLLSGAEIIRAHVKDMPSSAGVYRMIDVEGNVLYVGKAKNLKNRVGNYVSPSGLSTRIMRMVSLTRSMEIVTTKTEAEALLLESNLIKKLKPRYNILLRDDKSFPYILIPADHDFPQITKHRGARDIRGHYFGPFASAGAVNETLAVLEKAFLLRSCSDSIFKTRTRPCLQYQIKRCSAPCVGYVSPQQYNELLEQARRFLSGKSREVQERMGEEMAAASAAMEYEKAAALRDRIAALTRVQHEQGVIRVSLEDADVIALARSGGRSCVQVFFFRGGQNFGNKSYFPAHEHEATDSDILTAFIGQFYATQPPPKLILISHAIAEASLLEEALALRADGRVELHHPERGEKKMALDQAVLNAREALVRHLSEHALNTQMLEKVCELFAMNQVPGRIEVYDNSHIAGTHMVGAMICAGPEGFEKKHYRRFNIRTQELTPGDDYAMMREVLTRRFTRLQKEDPERAGGWPDLVLIDGGAGQLSVSVQVFADLGVTDVTLVAISKGPDRNAGREWFHMPGRAPFQLEPGDAVLHYLQRLRDEAHRFAIGSHRIKRSRALHESALDQIPGVGSTRKRALLQHFGSVREIESATQSELEKVEGVDRKTAEKIYRHFKE
jgi:excinuclease ABC subunit C